MTALPPECQAVLDHLDALRRGELPEADAATFQHHLEECRHCLCFERFEQAFLGRLRDASRHSGCPDGLRAWVVAQVSVISREL
jgi:anti-sigma factor (TIGR02949 family)